MTSSSFPSQANQLVIRPGRVSDCCDLAELINVSAEGAVDYLFSELRTVESSMQAMSRLLKREVYYSYVNTLVAEMRGELVGMALSFPSDGLMISDQMKNLYSKGRLQYIRYFVENKITDCWHLDALCVREQYRGCGIGKKLLCAVEEKAKEFDFDCIGVFVFGANTAAKRFYQRYGFKAQNMINTQGHEFLGNKGNLCLMQFDC